jgi:hypothetical protein
MGNTKPIGVAYSDQDIDGGTIGATIPSSVTGTEVFATSKLGYTQSAYGTVTQSGNKATGVTLNKSAGTITTANAQLAPSAEVAFIVTNSQVSLEDTVVVNIASGATATFAYVISVVTVQDGFFTVNLSNISNNAYTDTLKINFSVIHVGA